MKIKYSLFIIIVLLLVSSCQPTKHVPQGEYLLDRVKIEVDNKDVKSQSLKPYLRQHPNHKTFGIIGLPLALYNLSGTKDNRWNRFMRKIGTPPVIYDSTLTEKSKNEILKAMNNKGYINAEVDVDTVIKKRKIKVTYKVKSNIPYRLNRVVYNIPDDSIVKYTSLKDTTLNLLKQGTLFDYYILDQERERIATILNNRGYYSFNKDYITYAADTTVGNHLVDLEVNLLPYPIAKPDGSGTVFVKHRTYTIRDVYFFTDYNPMNVDQRYNVLDTVEYKGNTIYYGEKHYLKPSVLVNNCFIKSGDKYSQRVVDNTMSAYGRLRTFKYVNIQFAPVEVDGEMMLDCYILLTKGKTQTISTELEGTNSAGNFGFAVSATYQHRNIFRGSQTFSGKIRAAYENISGDLGGLISNNYLELGAEMGISFPKFIFPFAKNKQRQKLRPTTELTLSGNYQRRPEFVRVIAGAGWGYNWYSNRNRFRHKLDLVDISYIYLPKVTDEFRENINNLSIDNPLLRYSYEDHFIMRMAYAVYLSNLNPESINPTGNIYTFRMVNEIAGNLLYGISNAISSSRPEDGYSIFGIRYAQYYKCDMDYTYTFLFNEKNSLSLHVGAGVAIPYGNSEILPFEKRYFSGGANSVRGWSVRSLGPGSYKRTDPTTDFMNQCGDVRLDLNIEYRSKLIWKLELAAFIDAGNIWTIKEYDAQPGGAFKINKFYKELALAYGLGLRLDFDFFVLRLDLGMKAYNPAVTGKSKWVISYQNFTRDAALHFAVGYPF
ncbi:MAG: BamA/TamA family outer membrane protein [Bacteroidales bacterium]|nr:BamA/TamA family outer membrane protein [Bacteroidales bacterium]